VVGRKGKGSAPGGTCGREDGSRPWDSGKRRLDGRRRPNGDGNPGRRAGWRTGDRTDGRPGCYSRPRPCGRQAASSGCWPRSLTPPLELPHRRHAQTRDGRSGVGSRASVSQSVRRSHLHDRDRGGVWFLFAFHPSFHRGSTSPRRPCTVVVFQPLAAPSLSPVPARVISGASHTDAPDRDARSGAGLMLLALPQRSPAGLTATPRTPPPRPKQGTGRLGG